MIDEPTGSMGARILGMFDEHKLSANDGWLTLLQLTASAAVYNGLTLEQTQEMVAKAYAWFAKAYAKSEATGRRS